MSNKKISLPKKEVEIVFEFFNKGHYQKAINSLQNLNLKYPKQPLLFNLAGVCFKELNDIDAAIKMLNIAISLNSNYAEAHYNLAVIFQSLKQNDAAIESYKKAISISPKYHDAHNNLGNVFLDLGLLDSAIESLEWAVACKYDFAEAYNNLGNAYNEYGDTSKAINNYQKAIKFNKSYAKAYFNLALVYKDLGDKVNFIKNIEKALSLNSDWGHAYYHLSRVRKFKINDPQIKQMKLVLKKNSINLTDRIGLNFALSKAYEDIENYDEQFKFLDEANSLRKKELNYSIDKDKKLFAHIKETFKFIPSVHNLASSNPNSISPIFILGMPRSGTSLMHQILDSHKQVYGVGELNTLNKIVTPLLKEFNSSDKKTFTESDLLLIQDQYIKALPISERKEKIIVDKMPLNFRYLGFILTSFPDVKVIHMNRDPMATCWSIYKYEFRGNAYSFNQEDISIYYGLYLDLMNFWKKLFPNSIYDVIYEELTIDQENQTRKILQYCGLEWDENCLNFHKNKSAVKTTSSMQVREKMYQGSSEVWRKYEIFLQPLIQGLNKFKK